MAVETDKLHQLARSPGEINLQEVYHAIEGTDGFVECMACPEPCDRIDGCVIREVWTNLNSTSLEILEPTTLEDLVRRTRADQDTAAGA